MKLEDVVANIGAYTQDAILITEAEPIDEPGPRIVWANDSFTDMTGYRLEDLLGKSPRILQGPETSRAALDRIRNALAAWEPVRVEVMNYRKDGSAFMVDLGIHPVADSQGWYRYWVSIQREVAFRLEKTLVQEVTRLSLDDAPVGLALMSQDRTVQYANATLESIAFGRTQRPLLPMSYAPWISRAARQSGALGASANPQAWLSDHVERLFQFGYTVEETFCGAPHEFRLMQLSNGSTLLAVVDLRETVPLTKRLHEEVGRLESLGQRASGLAHDFNNLLAVILGKLELLKSGGSDHDESLESAILAIRKGRALSQNVLSYSRKAASPVATVDLGGRVKETALASRETLPDGLSIEAESSPGTHFAELSPGVLQAALLNLIANARDAMPDSGVIRVKVDDTTSADGKPATSIDVSDQGVGIADADLKRVFEPFFTTKPAGLGTGLGLTLVRDFVDTVGGAVSVESAEGGGTTIRLVLPRCAPPKAIESPPSASKPSAIRSVLVVEDNPDVLRVTSKILQKAGWTVSEAADGDAAFAFLVRHGPPDVILSDLSMPGELNGAALCEAVRAIYPDLPFVFMSGDPTAVSGSLPDRADTLIKPVMRKELLAALDRAIASTLTL